MTVTPQLWFSTSTCIEHVVGLPASGDAAPLSVIWDQDSIQAVLGWVRQVDGLSPMLAPVPGVSATELKHLARLGALILSHLGRDAPVTLVDNLSTSTRIIPPSEVAVAFSRLAAHNPHGHLSELYSQVVSPLHRRSLGTFFTPPDAAMSIVSSYASRFGAPETLVDVGAGVGIFTEVAYAHWPSTEAHAVDINPVTLGLQAVASHGKLTGKASLELADYRSWLSAANLGETTLFLGNPPYTRWQLLNKTDRLQLVISADGLAGSRANLSTLFLAITLAKLRKKDSLAMIVPAGWMRAEYGKGLREWLRQAHRRPIMLRRTDSWQFPQAIVETVVLEVGPEQTYRQPIRLFNWAQTESQELSRDGGAAPLTSARHPKMGQCASVALGLRLGDVLRVTRGIATGSIHTFVQPPNQWDDLGVPVHFRRTVVRRLRRGLSTCEPLLEIAELLVLESYVRGSERGLEDWLAAAEAAGIDQMFLCRKRSKWYDLSSEVRTPDIILSSLTRDRFHVARNDNQFTITNNLFGGYWEPAVNGNQRDRVLEWLRTDEGQNALMVDAAEEGNGLRRLSPRAVADLILPTRLMETGDNGHLSPRRVKPIGEAS